MNRDDRCPAPLALELQQVAPVWANIADAG